MAGQPLNAPVKGIASTSTGSGYWELGSDGGVLASATLVSMDQRGIFTSTNLSRPWLQRLAAAIGSLPGRGPLCLWRCGLSWVAARDWSFIANIVGVVPTTDGGGYWVVGADGGVFAFGDAKFLGSLPGVEVHVSDIVGIVPTPNGGGYWMVGADGGVFAFGDARYLGSLPAIGVPLDDIVGIQSTPTGLGYWMVGADGGVFAFGDAPFLGRAG